VPLEPAAAAAPQAGPQPRDRVVAACASELRACVSGNAAAAWRLPIRQKQLPLGDLICLVATHTALLPSKHVGPIWLWQPQERCCVATSAMQPVRAAERLCGAAQRTLQTAAADSEADMVQTLRSQDYPTNACTEQSSDADNLDTALEPLICTIFAAHLVARSTLPLQPKGACTHLPTDRVLQAQCTGKPRYLATSNDFSFISQLQINCKRMLAKRHIHE
jgi:hypothetical protein